MSFIPLAPAPNWAVQLQKLTNNMIRNIELLGNSGHRHPPQKRFFDLSFLPKGSSKLTEEQVEKAAKILRERFRYTCAWQIVMTEDIAKDSVRKYVKKRGVERLRWYLEG